MSQKTNSKNLTRRDFIRGAAAAGAVGIAVGNPLVRRAFAEKTTDIIKSKVILIRDTKVIDDTGTVDEKIIARMLDEALMELTGEQFPKDAWWSILNSGDILGIKSNVWRFLHTPHELEKTIIDRAMDAGVDTDTVSYTQLTLPTNPVSCRSRCST